jgi:hypothetical protein
MLRDGGLTDRLPTDRQCAANPLESLLLHPQKLLQEVRRTIEVIGSVPQ